MQFQVFGEKEVELFEPVGRAAIMRIQSSWAVRPYRPLKRADKYAQVFTYTFDDVITGLSSDADVRFSPRMAQQVLDDFDSVKTDLETLVVHCSRGKNRSPAIATGLAQACGLADHIALVRRHPMMNYDIYKTLVEAAADKGLLRPPSPDATVGDDFGTFLKGSNFFTHETYRWLKHATRTS